MLPDIRVHLVLLTSVRWMSRKQPQSLFATPPESLKERRWRDLNSRAGLSRPTAFRVRTLQPLGYISTHFYIINQADCPVNCFFFSFFCSRSSRKNADSIALHCGCRTSRVTRTLWLNPSISSRFSTEPAHPAFGFMLPMTALMMRDCTMAPAHIWQGSSVI